MEIAIPADFLSSGENGRLIELELKNLDHERSLIDGEFLTPIRSIEVNALVDGEDGTISFGQAAMLIIPLTSREMEMAGGNLSSLVVFQLNPVTGAWKSLPTLADSGSTPPTVRSLAKRFSTRDLRCFYHRHGGRICGRICERRRESNRGDVAAKAGGDSTYP